MRVPDWAAAPSDLRRCGYARLGAVWSPDECATIRGWYEEPGRFRSRVDMARYRFGRGEYQYFADPLPPWVEQLRVSGYEGLVAAAADWTRLTGQPAGYPPRHAEFRRACAAAGQTRPTPLLLRYRAGDYNCLHQDLYGEIAFPFQVVVGLSQPGVDYEGGELILVEQLPRAQSRAHVVQLGLGEAVAIATRYRPAEGKRGVYRTNFRHGVSTITRGERYTLGVIFHDAR
jgi:hypothetical protein